MSNPLYAFPTACEQTLRALARYPSRTAFAWPGGSITYAGATELIGRMQKVFMQLNLAPGARVAFLTANRADTWCAGVAAQLIDIVTRSLQARDQLAIENSIDLIRELLGLRHLIFQRGKALLSRLDNAQGALQFALAIIESRLRLGKFRINLAQPGESLVGERHPVDPNGSDPGDAQDQKKRAQDDQGPG